MRRFGLAMILAALGACSTTPRGGEVNPDQQFEALAGRYVEETLQTNPEFATRIGDHRFDDRLGDYSLAGVKKQRDMTARYLQELSAISSARLNAVNRIDYDILQNRLAFSIFSIDVLREYEWNPLHYNVS